MGSIVAGAQTIAVPFLSGTPHPMQERIQFFGITGVDGVGVHRLGKFPKPSNWTLKHYGTGPSLTTWYQSIATRVGEVVIVTNDQLVQYQDQIIESVSQPQKRTAWDLDGSSELWEVQLTTRFVGAP